MGSVTKLPVKFSGRGNLVPSQKIKFNGFAPGEEPVASYIIAVGKVNSVIKIFLDSGVQFDCYYSTMMLAIKTGGLGSLMESVDEFSSFVNNVFVAHVNKLIISYYRKNDCGYCELELSF
ncbi:MAG: hypothetical protein AAB471_01930 [Patescibacteria group bacterium]